MFHPQYYIADCIRRLGKIIAHNATDTDTASKYPPHDVNEFRKTFMETNATGTGLISTDFDMFAAVQKYMKFARKMNDLNGSKTESAQSSITHQMMDGAIYRYEQYLNAFRKSTASSPVAGDAEFTLIPTMDIELMWCSHLLDPKGYHIFSQDQDHCPTKKLHRPEHDHLVIAHSLSGVSGDGVDDDAVNQSKRKWDKLYGDGDYDDLWQNRKDSAGMSEDDGGQSAIQKRDDVQQGLESESDENPMGRYVCFGCFACCWMWVLMGGILILLNVDGEKETFTNVWIFSSGVIVTFSVLCALATWDENIKKKRRRENQRQREMIAGTSNANTKTANNNGGAYW